MRTCGDCIVCCVYLRIRQLDKPPMRHCKHVDADIPEVPGESVCYTGKGCTIYEDRPDEPCKGYRCEWINGHGADEDRPDRSGILIDRTKDIGNAVEVKPLWPDAADTPEGQETIERVARSKGMAALVLSFYERRLVRVVVP